MDEENKNIIAEQTEIPPISRTEIWEKGMLKTEVLKTRISSSDFSITESVSLISPIVADGPLECLFEEIAIPNGINMKTVSAVTSNANIGSSESVVDMAETRNEVEELLESINLQKEETEEILYMISPAKEKLKSFISRIESLVKSLQNIPKHSVENSRQGNNYLKSIYRKKLQEFASSLLDKVKDSIKNLEADYETLKAQEETISKTFENITGFQGTVVISTETNDKLKETVDHLAEEICLLKPKQLWEIEKVSYIETDIEMLDDLYLRFLSIEHPNRIVF